MARPSLLVQVRRVKSRAEPVGIIAVVGQQPLRFGKFVEQRRSTGIIADLPSGHEEADRATIRIAHGMQLGVHAAFCAADQTGRASFFARRREAVRGALR